ncbi:MAG: hypothetical protein IKQ06_06615 [Bacilli bacterium]|nr:hypothetical protein [Bacilli bacterium]
MKNIFSRKTFLILMALCAIAFLYFGAKGTYTAYESIVHGTAHTDVSQIHLLINGNELGSQAVIDNQIILDTITWTSTHTREGKISPGSTGYFTFELDPTGSEVAILYDIEFIDKVMDDDKIITFTNITSDRTLVRTDESTYSGIISLADIGNNQKTHITVSFEFDGDEDIIGDAIPNQVYEDLFEVNFHAVQYQGETLTPYTG